MMRSSSVAASLIAAALVLPAPVMLAVATPAAAQSTGCEAPRSSGRSIGRSILGRVIGDATNRVAGNLGYAARFVPSAEVADTLTDSIACRLDTQEQVKAKDATIEATRSEQVGSTSNWTSDTRANVSGRSTVVARDDAPAGQPNGSRCMVVDDIIIVNGEETRAQKRMCRVPPSTRYALAA
jgi:surface antigen